MEPPERQRQWLRGGCYLSSGQGQTRQGQRRSVRVFCGDSSTLAGRKDIGPTPDATLGQGGHPPKAGKRRAAPTMIVLLERALHRHPDDANGVVGIVAHL